MSVFALMATMLVRSVSEKPPDTAEADRIWLRIGSMWAVLTGSDGRLSVLFLTRVTWLYVDCSWLRMMDCESRVDEIIARSPEVKELENVSRLMFVEMMCRLSEACT